MKKLYAILTILTAILGLSSGTLNAQCENNNGILTVYGAPSVVGASVGDGVCILAGESFRIINLQAGSTYRISACGSDPGLDTRLTVYPSSGGGALAFNDDYCGLMSRLDFTSVDGSSIDVLLDATGPGNTCVSNNELCGSVIITLISVSGDPEYCTPQYASPFGGTMEGDFIAGISLGAINNQNSGATGGPNYTYYSNQVASLLPNTQYTLNIKNNPDYTERVAAWIDYNQDLEFSSDERLGQVIIAPGLQGNIIFTTPAQVSSGQTRIRIRMMNTIPFGVYMDPCGLATYGETEDYGVSFPTDPAGPSDSLNFSTTCGLSTAIQDNACPNSSEASITVSGLSNLGEENSLESVSVIIEHPWAADLDIYLVAPNGQTIELSTDNGGTGANYGAYSSGNCTQVAKFIMNASSPVTGANAPIIGSFIPEGNLESLNSGLDPNGIWKLKVCDDNAGDTGFIRYFGLGFKDNEAGSPPACAASYSIANGAVDVNIETDLSWTAGAVAPTAYDVYFGTNSNPGLVSDNQAGTSYDPGSLLPSTTYYYLVVPSNAFGEASSCEVRSFTTADPVTPLPGCAQNFSPSNGEQGVSVSTTLEWEPGTGPVTGYNVFFGTDPLNLSQVVDDEPETNFTPAGPLSQGTTYYYLVVPVNAAGSAENCEPIAFTTQVSEVPACAANLSPADDATGVSTSVTLSWSAGPGSPIAYDVYFGTEENNLSLVGDSINQTTYSPASPLQVNTTYYWKVVPLNGSGPASGCQTYSFTTTSESGILMTDGSTSACSGVFYDSGGQSGNYGDLQYLTFTIHPATPGSMVKLEFTSFELSSSSPLELDNLFIINGADPGTGDIIGTYSGTNSPGTVTSYSPDGALSFIFLSDFSGNAPGWAANISCVTPSNPPSCASNLIPADSATDVSTDVVLSWEAGTGEITTAYSVMFGTDPGNLQLVSEDQIATSYAPQNLNPETTYYWQVIPENIIGQASGCPVLSFTTAAQAIECAQNFSPVNGTDSLDSEVLLTWDAPASGGVTSYDVYFGTDPFNMALISDNQASTNFTLIALDPLTTYYWQIIPNGDNGSASNCTITSFVTGGSNDIPCAQSFVPADQAENVDVNADLMWAPGEKEGTPGPPLPAVYTYDVYFGTDPGNMVQVSNDQDTQSFDPGQLEPGTTYYWQVIPSEDGVEATGCDILSFTTSTSLLSCVSSPAPANGAMNVDPSTAEISWSPGSGSPEFYDVYFGTDSSNLTLVSQKQTETAYEVGMLDEGTNYYWLVIPYTSQDTADACTQFSFTTMSAPTCATGMEPVDGAVNVPTTQLLSWQAVSGATGYNVYVGLSENDMVLVSEDQSGTTYTPAVLLNNTQYFWQVVPVNDLGEAVYCAVLDFTTEDAGDELVIFNGELSTCSDTLYDSGGSSGNYSNGEAITLTLYPATPGSQIKLDFLSFYTETNWDSLYVYSGNTASGIPALTLTGEILQNLPNYTSTAPDGSVTLVFKSDDSGTRPGFSAAISCFTPTEVPDCAVSMNPADGAVDQFTDITLTWAAGDGNPTGYDVYFGTDPGSMVQVGNNQPGTSYVPTLSTNTTYYWQVVPRNSQGAAVDCPVYSFTTGEEEQQDEILMQDGTVSTCNAVFYDDGGLSNNYTNSKTLTLTVQPETAGNAVKVVFNSFASEFMYDSLYVYSGSSASGTPIGVLNGQNMSLPLTFISGSVDGNLTFKWKSDGSLSFAGWNANLSCVDQNEALSCVENATPANGSQGVSVAYGMLSWNPGQSGVPTGYDVYFGTAPDALTLVSDDQVASVLATGNLETSTTYYWQVVPFNGNGQATDCPIYSFTTSSSQEIEMSNGTVYTCDANFYDTGGPNGAYGFDEDSVLTICPDAPNKTIQVIFSSIQTEINIFNPLNPYDYLEIFDGNSTSADPIVNPNTGGTKFAGTTVPAPIISTSPDGCITFRFTSDDLFSYAGWQAKINCLTTNEPPACASLISPLEGDTGICRNVTIAWAPAPGSLISGYDVYFDSGNGLELVSDDQTGTTYTVDFLDANTEYSYKIVPYNANGEAADCDAITFKTGTCVTYCEAGVTGEDACFEHISNVTLGSDINQSSGCPDDDSGYTDYTSVSGNLYIGIQTPISVTNGEAYSSDSCRVWVDWNQDGDFTDAGEAIELAGQPFGPYVGTITPPMDALPGETRMRVRITDISIDPLEPCGLSVYGETEDYTIFVLPAPSCPYPNNILVSDQTNTTAALTWDEVSGAESYSVRYRKVTESDTVGTWVNAQVINGLFTILEGLSSCEGYVLQVSSICEEGEDLFYSHNIPFSTHCIECPANATAEAENCGANENGGCLIAPPAYQSISCGESICGSVYFDGNTRDTDWFSIDVANESTYTFNLNAEFNGSMFIVDVSDCDDPVIVTQGPDFTANVPYSLASNLQPGHYAVFVAPSFDSAPFGCGERNRYVLTFNGGNTEIAPVAPVCETAQPFNLFAIPAGGSWSGTGITDALNGTFDPAVSGVGTFIITYNASNNACATSDTVVVTVTGNTTTAPGQPSGPETICMDAPDSEFSIQPVSGVTEYLWVLSPNEAGTISGTGTTATVNWSAGFSGTASVVVAAQSACGMSDFSLSGDVQVLQTPQAPGAIEGPATSCAGSQNYFSPGAGSSTLNWSLNPSTAGTISGSGNTVTVTWSEGFTGNATLSVTASNFCGTSSATDLAIEVLSTPFVDFVGLAAEYCSSDIPAVLTGIPAGGYFTITGGAGITGNVFDPSQAGAGSYTITYFNQVDGCLGSIAQNVTVVSGPQVSINAVADMCSNSQSVSLSGTPSGGIFNGPGVSGNTFNPAIVIPGQITVSYTVTDQENECSGLAKTTFTVNPAPVVNVIADKQSVCVDAPSVALTGVPAPGTFEGTGVSGSIFNPSEAGIGVHTIRYTVNNGTCSSSDSTQITVTAIPDLSISSTPATVCTNDDVIQLSSTPSGALFSGPGIIGSTFNPKLAGLGTHTITATLYGDGCNATASRLIAVNRSPEASFNIAAPGYTVNINNTSLYSDTYNWDFGDGTTSTEVNPTHHYAGNGFYTIKLVAGNALCGTDTFSVNVDISVGVGEVAGVDQIQVFPNPTAGLVNVVFNVTEMQSFDIRIMDAAGRLIKEESLRNSLGKYNLHYDLSDVAKGIYLFSIRSEKGMMNYRIVKD